MLERRLSRTIHHSACLRSRKLAASFKRHQLPAASAASTVLATQDPEYGHFHQRYAREKSPFPGDTAARFHTMTGLPSVPCLRHSMVASSVGYLLQPAITSANCETDWATTRQRSANYVPTIVDSLSGEFLPVRGMTHSIRASHRRHRPGILDVSPYRLTLDQLTSVDRKAFHE